MMSATLLMLVLATGGVLAQSSPAQRAAERRSAAADRKRVNEFRTVLRQSRVACRREPQTLAVNCPAKSTTGELVRRIPGKRQTVNMFASADLKRTIDMCVERQGDDAGSHKTIERTRPKMGLTLRDEQWTECKTQMQAEKRDCEQLNAMLCAMGNGQAFECAPTTYRQRESRTLDVQTGGDQCYAIVDFAYGRPKDARAFRKRTGLSKRNCRKDQDLISVRCKDEKTIDQLVATLPDGVNFEAALRGEPVLALALERCRLRERHGWTQMLRDTRRLLSGGKNAKQRNACIKELNASRAKECKALGETVCGYTYGTDLSCARATAGEARAADTTNEPCAPVDAAVRARLLADGRL